MNYLDIKGTLQHKINQAEIMLDIAVAQQDSEQVNICCAIITKATIQIKVLSDMDRSVLELPKYLQIPF